MTILHTKRLRLRSWQLTDVGAYAEACNTPGVMRWLGGVQSQAAVAREVRYFGRAEARDGVTFWVVEHARSKQLLGFCGLLRMRSETARCATKWKSAGEYESLHGVKVSHSKQRLPCSITPSSVYNFRG